MHLALVVMLTAAATVTPEERALQALLDGRPTSAVRVLEAASEEEPLLRWIAGKVALAADDLDEARRLFDEGETPADAWGKIEVLLAEGDDEQAAGLALSQMDDALSGKHRDALARLLMDQAEARRESEPNSARRLFRAVLDLDASPPIEREAEDALFSMAGAGAHWLDDDLRKAAFSRLEDEEGDDTAGAGSSLVAGLSLSTVAPTRAYEHLLEVVRLGDRDLAFEAGKAAKTLGVPPSWRISLLDELGERFADDAEVARLRLALASSIARLDETRGIKALSSLTEDLIVGPQAVRAIADLSSDPMERRSAWLAVAELESHSTRALPAREEATRALVDWVEAAAGKDARRKRAERALDEPDGAGHPSLLFHALPDGQERIEGMWGLVERFPEDGPWCVDLAESLLSRGASREEAARFAHGCSSPETPEVEALLTHAGMEPDERSVFLSILTKGGGELEVLAAGNGPLQVSQSPVDPEVLFRTSTGNPLDTHLDAFLIAPERSFEVPLEPDSLSPIRIETRGRDLLVAMTVRAGDEQAVALVPRDLLEVQAIRSNETMAVAVLHDGEPVRRARLLVLDEGGNELEGRTNREGLARIEGVVGSARVMARTRRAIGFAEIEEGEPHQPSETLTLQIEDRFAPREGARSNVRVFAAKPWRGDATGAVTLRSLSGSGTLLEEVDVELAGGTAAASLLLQGGGRVIALRGDETRAVETVSAPAKDHPLAISFSPATPVAGETVTVSITSRDDLPPDGLHVHVTMGTRLQQESHELVLLDGEPMEVELSLGDEPPGEALHVLARLEHSRLGPPRASSAQAIVTITGSPPPPIPSVPVRVAPGGSLGTAGVHRALRNERLGMEVWAEPGEELIVPSRPAGGSAASASRNGAEEPGVRGVWKVSSWVDGRESPEAKLLVVGEDDPHSSGGTWKGASPVLLALLAGNEEEIRLLSPGDEIEAREEGWTALGSAKGTTPSRPSPPLPPRHIPAPEVTVDGSLVRGEAASIHLGNELPEGAVLYAVVRDSSDFRELPADPSMQDRLPAPAGTASPSWLPSRREGNKVHDALLAEERRLAERAPAQRAALTMEQVSSEVSVGTARGLAGFGGVGAAGGAIAVQTGRAVVEGRPASPTLPAHRGALLVLEGEAPGSFELTAPAWVTAAEVDLVARLPDGTWMRKFRRLSVDGPPPGPLPAAAKEKHPETWDGTLEALREIALTLTPDARAHALAALVEAGDDDSVPHLRLTLDITGPGPGRAMAAHLGHGEAPDPSDARRRLQGLPDPRHVERVLAALVAAGSDPELASSVAHRLLRETDLSPWVRARAGQVLLVAGEREAALDALDGEQRVPAAGRAAAGLPLPAKAMPGLYALARADTANPLDRALALHALSTSPGEEVEAGAETPPPGALEVEVQPPLASLRGRDFERGTTILSNTDAAQQLEEVDRFPAGRTVPVTVRLEPFIAPSRVLCPSSGPWTSRTTWIEVAASETPTKVVCHARAREPGEAELAVGWHGPCGRLIAGGKRKVVVEAPRAAATDDPMSPDERYHLGVAMARAGLAGGDLLLRPLLSFGNLRPRAVVGVSEALLRDAKQSEDPARLVSAFEAARERSQQSTLDLETAAAVARAYHETGGHERTVRAVKAVLDGRFREELAAIRRVQGTGLPLSAFALLGELMQRYPEVPTLIQARYLAPSILLEQSGDSHALLGYTRSSLRHTAAGDLARFLLLHGDEDVAVDAALLLSEALRLLGDHQRALATSGHLASALGTTEQGWRLSVADARARFATGDLRGAARALDGLDVTGAGAAAVALERGRVAEARGRLSEALELYSSSSLEEATQRARWLERRDLDPPSLFVLRRGESRTLDASIAPGSAVELSATPILLENLLLRDSGIIDPSSAVVDGLAAERARTVRADSSGNLRLPRLGRGAWLVTAALDGEVRRFIVSRSDLSMDVRESERGGALIQLHDRRGRPVEGASIWAFGDAETATATTDALGAAWLAEAAGRPILARADEEYAYWKPPRAMEPHYRPPHRTHAPSPADRHTGEIIQQNIADYEALFHQESRQSISVKGL